MPMKGLIGLVVAAAASILVALWVSWGGTRAADPRIGTAVLPELARHLSDAGRLTILHGET